MKKLEMLIVGEICQVVVISLILESMIVNCLKCEENATSCKTGLCNSNTGTCICNLPDPSTILDGDRVFLGGKFCDEEMTMCDGTNSFWCENGGTCEEIIQGENYTCKCPPGYDGVHCQYSGIPCGRIFCFHEAECRDETGDNVCQCQPDWKGSVDCSYPTKKPTDSSISSTANRLPQERSSNDTNWTMMVLAIFGSVGALGGCFMYVKNLCSKQKSNAVKFQQLSQMHTQEGIIFGDNDDDDDDSDSITSNRIHDSSRL